MDMHTTPRAQDDIYGKVVHRTLYNYDSDKGVPVLELAKSVAVSNNGLTHTFKLRDDAFFHNGKKMTADDIIYSFTRIMDGKRGFSAARWVRIIKGAVEVEKGQATAIEGLKKIDDFTLEMTLTDRVDPGIYFYNGNTAIYPAGEADKPEFLQKPIGLGPFKFVEHVPGSRLVADRWEKFYKPGMPYADKVVIAIMGEAPARDIAFRNKEIDLSILGPAQYVAYREDPNLKNGILEVAGGLHPPHGHEPRLEAVRRQARAPGDQPCDRHRPHHQAPGEGQGLPGGQLAAVDVAGLRQGPASPTPSIPRRRRSCSPKPGYPNGFEFEWTTSQNESWGLPIVEAVIPMLARVGIKVKVKQVEVTVLVDLRSKGEFEAFILSNQSGPDALGALKCFHSATPMTACNYFRFKNAEFDKLVDQAGQTDERATSATRCCARPTPSSTRKRRCGSSTTTRR